MRQTSEDTNPPRRTRDELIRLPGLFPRWEIEHVLDEESEFTIEATTSMLDGEPLYVVYRREPITAPER
jgi:hypothetical protein